MSKIPITLIAIIVSSISFLSFGATPVHALGIDYLVPCGQDIIVQDGLTADGKAGICYYNECSACSAQILASRILNALVFLATLLATVLFINAGVLYVFSPANLGNIEKAKTIFVNTFWGFFILLGAWLIIDTVMRTLYAQQGTFGPWNDFLCKNYTGYYCVPKIETATLSGKTFEPIPVADDVGLNCEAQLGGSCHVACLPFVSVSRNDTSCAKNTLNKTCCLPRGTGNSCTSALVKEKKGTCQSFGLCGERAEVSKDCTGGLVCCPSSVSDDVNYDSTKISSADAERILRENKVKIGTSIYTSGTQPVQQGVIDTIVDINNRSGGLVIVNSLTGGRSHQSPTNGHYNGRKADFEDGPAINAYLQTWSVLPGARGPTYKDTKTNTICVHEDPERNHWDCCFNVSGNVCN